ncbi:unnamed protein product [Lampetra fluviatilis]
MLLLLLLRSVVNTSTPLYKERSELANSELPGEEQWHLRPVDGAPLPKDGVHYALWLMGKLRMRVRALHSARQQLCTLLHHVHSTCRQPHQPGKHLSGTEAYLLRHPNRLTQVLQQLGEENARLEAFIEWRNMEPAFWQWMVSMTPAVVTHQGTRCFLSERLETLCRVSSRASGSLPQLSCAMSPGDGGGAGHVPRFSARLGGQESRED